MALRRPSVPARSTRGSTRPLSRELIVDTAMRVLDAEGIDAVTMRRVALELDTGAASLYAHVTDKDDLYAALIDRVIGEAAYPHEPDPQRWQEQLKELLRGYRSALRDHRDVARAAMGVIPLGPNALPAFDRVLGILLAGRLPHQVAAWAADILSLYVTAVAFEESIDAWPRDDPAAFERHVGELRTFFAGLSPQSYPHLTVMASALTVGDDQDRFEFGLDVLVRGIAATAAGPPDTGDPAGGSGAGA